MNAHVEGATRPPPRHWHLQDCVQLRPVHDALPGPALKPSPLRPRQAHRHIGRYTCTHAVPRRLGPAYPASVVPSTPPSTLPFIPAPTNQRPPPLALCARPPADQRIALLGAMQSLFEASMYTFVFLWTPALSPNDEKIYHGMIFACFMTSSMAGSALSSMLMKRYKVCMCVGGVHLLASFHAWYGMHLHASMHQRAEVSWFEPRPPPRPPPSAPPGLPPRPPPRVGGLVGKLGGDLGSDLGVLLGGVLGV